jgi:hypothetical protein
MLLAIMQVSQKLDLVLCSVLSLNIGHPLPHPHLANVGPATEGVRRGLLPAYPRTIVEETWLRGAWPTDKNGVVQFTSKPAITVALTPH